MKTKKYRVFARCVTALFIDVEASTRAEALQIAEEADGGDFTECPDADWEITEATLLTHK